MVQNTRTTAAPKGSALVAFLFFTLFVAGAPVAIRMTYAELAPFSMAALRFGLAALILWGIVLYKHIPLPRGRALAGALLYGALTVGLAFLFINWGLVATPAGRASILMATIPLLSVFLSALHGVERITRRGLLGASLAVAGIAVTAASPANGQASLPHMAAILMGAGLSAEGGVLVKWFPPSPVVVTNAIAVTVGGAILGIASLAAGEAWIVPAQARHGARKIPRPFLRRPSNKASALPALAFVRARQPCRRARMLSPRSKANSPPPGYLRSLSHTIQPLLPHHCNLLRIDCWLN